MAKAKVVGVESISRIAQTASVMDGRKSQEDYDFEEIKKLTCEESCC